MVLGFRYLLLDQQLISPVHCGCSISAPTLKAPSTCHLSVQADAGCTVLRGGEDGLKSVAADPKCWQQDCEATLWRHGKAGAGANWGEVKQVRGTFSYTIALRMGEGGAASVAGRPLKCWGQVHGGVQASGLGECGWGKAGTLARAKSVALGAGRFHARKNAGGRQHERISRPIAARHGGGKVTVCCATAAGLQHSFC